MIKERYLTYLGGAHRAEAMDHRGGPHSDQAAAEGREKVEKRGEGDSWQDRVAPQEQVLRMPEGYRAQGGRPTEKQQKSRQLQRITMILS